MAKYIIEIKDNCIINLTPLTKSMEIDKAKEILEEYVGDHIAIIGKGKTLSDRQKRELRQWADTLAPIEEEDCCDCCDECCDCCDEECEDMSVLAGRMIIRIREILGE